RSGIRVLVARCGDAERGHAGAPRAQGDDVSHCGCSLDVRSDRPGLDPELQVSARAIAADAEVRGGHRAPEAAIGDDARAEARFVQEALRCLDVAAEARVAQLHGLVEVILGW